MPVEIIAEIGCNHGGNVRTAFALVDAAKNAGADFCKFQTWFRQDFTHVPFEPWTKDVWRDLFLYCNLRQMPWFSTPFDLEAIAFLKECGMKIWKGPSGMMTNRPYLEAIKEVSEHGRVILSCGMCTKDEIKKLYLEFGIHRLTDCLYCVSLYPAKPEEINFDEYKGFPFSGFSDHSEGDELAIAAVALGAKIIEKHLTLDRTLPGPDHKASLDPTQFAEMVRKIRNVEQALIPKPMSEREYAQRDTIRKRMAFQ